MNTINLLASSFGVVLVLTSCGSVEWQVGAACEQSKKCRIEGKIGGKIGDGPQGRPLLHQRLLAVALAEVPDATHFEIDVSGSTVAFPMTGEVLLSLVDTRNGTVTATRQFGWRRAGATLRLADADAVNAWAAASGGSADELRYSLIPFFVGAAPGPNTIATASRYRGTRRAASVSDFNVCTKYPSPYQCGAQ